MGTNQSVVCVQAASAAHEAPHQQYIPALKQQQQTMEKASVAPVYAADSASSISGSHMESEQELKQHPAVGRKLLATVRDSLLRKPWSQLAASVVLSGIPTHTAEQQAAVQAAYDEVLAGAKQRFEDFYQMGHMLGSGHYARVHVAKCHQDGTTYAAKVLPKAVKKSKARKQLQSVVKEVAVMRLLADHPSAVKLHQVLQDKQNYYLVMEHCSGGELFDHVYKVDHLPEAEAAYYMGQLASFLAYAHSKDVVHRDIKPENMLLAPACPSDSSAPTKWRLKVIDYGCSAFCMPGQKLHDAVGTVCYVAPEVLWHNYDSKSDVWSAGVVLYMLLCGYLPFDGRNNEETLLLVRAGDFDMLPEDWSHVSQHGQQVVRQLLSYKPKGRPTAAQLLQNSWIQQCAATLEGAAVAAPAAGKAGTGEAVDVAASAGSGAPAAEA